VGAPGRLAVRARIVLAASRGATNARIAARLGVHLETVARWRARFVVNGLEGISREAPRAGGAGRVSRATVRRIVHASLAGPAGSGPRWTTRSLARTLNVNHMLVHRVWASHGLAPRAGGTTVVPHVDLGGAFVTPAARALVFTVDERRGAAPPGARVPELVPNPTGAEEFSGPEGRSLEVVRAVGAIEAATPKGPRSAEAPLLVFLRGVERNAGRAPRLEVVFDRPLARLGRGVRRWLSAHTRFRVFTPAREQRWSEAVDAWLRRWGTSGMARDSLGRTPEFARQFSGAPSRGGPAPRFTWGLPTVPTAGAPWRGPASELVPPFRRGTDLGTAGSPQDPGQDAGRSG